MSLGRYRNGRPSSTKRRLPLVAAAVGAVVLMLALGGSALSFGPAASSTWVVSGGSGAVGTDGGGGVNSTVVSGSTAYLGGDFAYVGPPTGGFVAADPSGALASSRPSVDGNVFATAPDGNGGFFIGGFFSSIGTKHASNIAHINADGSLDTSWTGGTNGTVYAIQVSASSVFAGGAFTTAGGAAHANLAAFGKTTGTVDSTFTVGATGTPSGQTGAAYVASLRLSGSNLYVGGRFASLGGNARTNIGAVTTTGGAVPSWAPSTNNVVYALAVGGDGTVYAGGAFTFVNGNPEKYAAAFNAVGDVTSWVPAPDKQVFALEVVGSTVYVGGAFGTIGSPQVSRTGLAALTATGGSASTWDPKVAGQVYAIAAPGDGSTVYAGGAFRSVNTDVARDNLVALDATTANATSFTTAAGGNVDALAMSGGKVGIGGEFRSAGPGGSAGGPVPRSNLAAIDLTTGKATNWSPSTNNTVDVLMLSGSRIYAGGEFTAANGFGRDRLAAFTSDGTLTTWNPGVHNGKVLALALVGSTVYAGGTFTSVSNPATERDFAAAFQADGQGNGLGDLTSWNPNPNAAVSALDAIGTTVYIGGELHEPDPDAGSRLQYNRNWLAAVSSSGIGVPTNWNPNIDNSVFALTHVGTTVYAGGAFGTVNGTSCRAAAVRRSQPREQPRRQPGIPWHGCPGTVPAAIYSLAASASTMYVGGSFDSVGGAWTGAVRLQRPLLPQPVGRGRLARHRRPERQLGSRRELRRGLARARAAGARHRRRLHGDRRPAAGSAFTADETVAAYRVGFALVPAPPDAPVNVTAIPGDTTATVSWQAPAYTGGGGAVTYAIVLPDGSFLTPVTSPTTVTGLPNGVPAKFSVYASTSAGLSAAGDSDTVTPNFVPGAPTGVTGVPSNGQVSVSFTPAAPNAGPPVTGYTVTAQPGNISMPGTSSPIVVSGLTNGQAYTFTVTATNAIGPSAASTPSSPVTPFTVPDAPTNVTATAADGQATVTYQAPPSNGSAITLYTATSTPGNLTGTSTDGSPIVVSGLTNGSNYSFTVVAKNLAGDGPASVSSNSVTPRTVPGAPTGVVATAGDRQATVVFTLPASDGGDPITTYIVTPSPSGTPVEGTSSPITVTGLTNGQAYTFTVTARNAVGNGAPSAASNPVSPGSPATAPGAPTAVLATAGNAQATVAFTAPASDGGAGITQYTVTSSPGGKTAQGPGQPAHGDRPDQRPELHVHGHGEELDRRRAPRRRRRTRSSPRPAPPCRGRRPA